jgi:multisubunit Na+/H+ antiporter MnhC subunit
MRFRNTTGNGIGFFYARSEHMFKKFLKDESGDAAPTAVILTGIFIGAGVVFIAITYGIKVQSMLDSLGGHF